MLPHKIIQETLHRHSSNSACGQKFLNFLLERGGYGDVIELVADKSRALTTQMRKEAEILQVSPQMTLWLNKIPLLWIPSQAFISPS